MKAQVKTTCPEEEPGITCRVTLEEIAMATLWGNTRSQLQLRRGCCSSDVIVALRPRAPCTALLAPHSAALLLEPCPGGL